jgi:hypothetical protein
MHVRVPDLQDTKHHYLELLTLVYANPKCNRVAPELTKKVSNGMVARVWYEIPACIVAEDCNYVAI